MPKSPPTQEEVARHKQANVMLSRVAGSLYWMSRYLERAENLARLVDVNLQIILDFGQVSDETMKEHWLPILRSTGDEDLFFQLYEVADSESVMEFVTFRQENPNSLLTCIGNARENARQVRDQISSEMWEVLNDAYHFIKNSDPENIWDGGASAFYDQIKYYSHLFQGITVSTFSRNEGFEFIQFGKYLERADKTTRLMDMKYHILLPKVTDVGGAVDAAQWQAVLRSASAVEPYRRFYVADILFAKVIEFLIFEDTFPRSLMFCLQQMDDFAHLIAGTPAGEYRSEGEHRFGKFLNNLNFTTTKDIIGRGLHEFLAEVQREIGALGEHLYTTFMYHPPVDMQAEIRFHQQQEQQQQ
ncbi:alpha-E domain-containing protein [Prosthecobacter dejongeii]|uniref:Putative alpha-E superfamily protein n=1 Tax=Prosthecobacter dejongeii TaxID=48465 RepID=A0A7W7YQE0_9BACT|nr:alpha-E domain-containing protein [Prosthecobacter dejongeii]MBB5040423.1 putative alpha-E superfamily protein [Prosthecobacter dejongeii]